jgi:hypothetical protein
MRHRDPVGETPRALGTTFRDMGPRWSHDGRRIAFLRVFDSGHVQVCVAPPTLDRVCALTMPEIVNPDAPPYTGRATAFSPDGVAWSADDTRIAFARGLWVEEPGAEPMPGASIWAVRLADGQVSALASPARVVDDSHYVLRYPAWSADGRTLAAVAQGKHDRTRVGFATVDGFEGATFGERFDSFALSDWPAWAPAGRRAAIAQGVLRGPHASRVATIRVLEPGSPVARRLCTVTADAYRRMCPADVSRHAGVTIQPYVAALAWDFGGASVLFSVTPDAMDLSRYSVWRVGTDRPDEPRRLTADGAAGYHAPRSLERGALGVLRYSGGSFQAVQIGPGGDDTVVASLRDDDFDWRPSGGAVAVAGDAQTDAARPGIRILP